LLFREGNPAGVKNILRQMEICDETVRLPLVSVSKDLAKQLTAYLKSQQ
jgi:4-hydroxy-tetrahydrodipicolinate synthase